MEHSAIKSVIIVGGGTAGWSTAMAMSKILKPLGISITLIESAAIGTVGVGEATLPHFRYFNQTLGIDEAELIRKTKATYKLGIEFKDWRHIGHSYIHPFGDYGLPINRVPFHHYVTRAINAGRDVDMDQCSLPVMAARAGKFQHPHPDPDNVLSTFGYAYQFDAGLYATFLREKSEEQGVRCQEGRIVTAHLNGETGDIDSVELESGARLTADIFIDCSGFRGLLIEQALKTGYHDWTQYLPCDRAITAACEHRGPSLPYTRATAKASGWQWRIPLQHRTGNGYVYSCQYISDDEACATLMNSLEGQALTEPRVIRFKTGQRRKSWHRNCIAIGLSGGFLEPLESTGIYLIQQAITHFIGLFPQCQHSDVERTEYNRLMDIEFERVRDFLILHYVATTRDDSPFWNHCRAMPVPDSLRYKMDIFKQSGQVVNYETGAFKTASWLAVYYGQGIVPDGAHPMSHHMSDALIAQQLDLTASTITKAVAGMQDHKTAIAQANT